MKELDKIGMFVNVEVLSIFTIFSPGRAELFRLDWNIFNVAGNKY